MGQIIGIVCGILIVGSGLTVINVALFPDRSHYVLKSDVIEAMKGDWRTNVFWNNSSELKDDRGNTQFYAVKDIDERIEKLNKVLSK